MNILGYSWKKDLAIALVLGAGTWGATATIPSNPKIVACTTQGIVGIGAIDDAMSARTQAVKDKVTPPISDDTVFTFRNPANGSNISFTYGQKKVCDAEVAKDQNGFSVRDKLIPNFLLLGSFGYTSIGLIKLYTDRMNKSLAKDFQTPVEPTL